MDLSLYTSVQITFFVGAFIVVYFLGGIFARFIETPEGATVRAVHLDGLRALAATAVVTCHTNQHLLAFFGFTEIPAVGNSIGVTGVYMFFALTSFLFTDRALRRGLDSKDFYIGRARRIVPLYLFVATCTVLMSLTKSSAFLQNPAQTLVSIIDVYLFGFTSSLTDPALMLNGVNTASLIGIAWSLVFEWKFYLVFPALYFLVKSSRTLGLALILVLVVIAARDFYQITEAVWPFFLSGALIAYLKNSFPTLENLSPSTKKALALLSVPALVVVLAIPGNWGAGQLVSATVLFFLVMFGEPKLLKVRNLRTIGVISYSIYLIQYLVLAPVSNKAHSLGIVDASPTWKFIAAFSVPILLVAFSCLTYKYIERPWMSSKKHGSAPDSSATRDLPAN